MKDPNKIKKITTIEDLKNEVKGAVYIINSTLNQAVNYIPAKLLDLEIGINVTLNDNTARFNNKKWDEYLGNALGIEIESRSLALGRENYNNVHALKEKIKKEINKKYLNKEKFVWNITGGQRPFVMAVTQLVTEIEGKHYIIYLEGNTGQMIVLNKNMSLITDLEYNLKELLPEYNIETALKLMGFDFKFDTTEDKRFEDETFKTIINKIYDKYIKDKKFREELILTNKKDKTEQDFSRVLEHVEADKDLIKKYFGGNYHGKSKTKFGYLLEDMIFYALMFGKNNVSNGIFEIHKSLELRLPETGNTAVDEFDVILMNKYGQITIFEAKSGIMSGDVAKSTKYSTYAVGGVYGMPILITPLTAGEINQGDFFNDNIKKAIYSAKRAGLEVWGVDEITERIKPYLGK